MKRGILLFALFCVLSFAFRDQLTEEQQMLFDDYNTAVEKLSLVIPTLDNGGEDAVENLRMLRRIMSMILTRFVDEQPNLPALPSDPIANLKEAIGKIDQLIEARDIINEAEKAQEAEKAKKPEESSSAEPLNPCTQGPCCNTKMGVVLAAGMGCNITDVCLEPAALCDGLHDTCATAPKPDGTNCGEAMECISGVCQRSKDAIRAENEAKLIAIKEAELLKKKAIHRMLKVRQKQELKQKKDRIVKKMLKKFAVMSWMNKKTNSWEADIKAGDYVAGLPNAPTHQEIFAHHYVGDNDAILHSVGNFPVYDQAVSTVVEASSGSATNTTSTESTTTNLMASNLTATSASSLGFVLIGIGLILIVVYFVFGGKKKPQPQTIY